MSGSEGGRRCSDKGRERGHTCLRSKCQVHTQHRARPCAPGRRILRVCSRQRRGGSHNAGGAVFWWHGAGSEVRLVCLTRMPSPSTHSRLHIPCIYSLLRTCPSHQCHSAGDTAPLRCCDVVDHRSSESFGGPWSHRSWSGLWWSADGRSSRCWQLTR